MVERARGAPLVVDEGDCGKSTILEEKVDPNYEPTQEGDFVLLRL
jgi:hypothetical protein